MNHNLVELLSIKSVKLFKKTDQRIITYLNHHSYLIARKNIELFSQFDVIDFDGTVLCIFMRMIGFAAIRKSFDMTSIAPIVFEDAVLLKNSIYFIGSEEGVAAVAVSKIVQKFSGLIVCGVRHGFFSSNVERQNTIAEIIDKQPSIVVVGMGTPHQELFLSELKVAGWRGTGYTCGGFLHQTAKAGLSYYPVWVDRFNLRWAFRIKDEPKLFRRYSFEFIIFIFVFAYDFTIFKMKR